MSNLSRLQPQRVGSSCVMTTTTGHRLANGPTTANSYTNAQLDDYHGLKRRHFHWHPPLHLALHARFSHSESELRGTAGFGFWNDPFGAGLHRLPTLPRALWFFFSSPPSAMTLALDVPGPGWKAATIDTWRWPFLLLAPTTPVAMSLMRFRSLYRLLWPIGQRAIGVYEAMLAVDMTEWHTYRLEWDIGAARFWVDDHLVLTADQAPRGPLGLVIWKDNQAMTISPWQLPRHQLVACNEEQWMEVADVTIGA